MKSLRLATLSLILLTTIFFAFKTYELEQQKGDLKNDLIELSKIKYGLFSVDEWKVILADIVTKRVEEFNLDKNNKEEMRIKISTILTTSINELEDRYYDEKSKTLIGFLQGGVATVTGTFGKIKEDIPIFTEQIIAFLNDDENRDSIREYLLQKLNDLSSDTFSETDYSTVNNILMKYEQEDSESTKVYLKQQIEQTDTANRRYKILLVILAIAAIGIMAFLRSITINELTMGLVISLAFLVLGILLPMIEIDARISEMTFHLMGEEIKFTDQVLYFKSKSILEVVHLMIAQNKIDLIAVGILVLTFSVLFPFLKLISSVFYLKKIKTRSNAFVSFMVLKSGKWSMADVMVIAIFMAYIGFDGIITEQLELVENLTNNLDLLTTNKSNLLFGYYSFTLFVILSMTISQKIQSVISKP